MIYADYNDHSSMEAIIDQLQDSFSSFKELSSFDAFVKQAAHLVYTDLHQSSSKENAPSEIFDKYFTPHGAKDEVLDCLSDVFESPKESVSIPKYEIKAKKTQRVRNPKTGRDIYVGGDLFTRLVETGWLDQSGNAMKEYTVQKMKNPKTGKTITVRGKVYNELLEEGWVDKEGNILKVMNPKTEQPLDVSDPEFQDLVREGLFNRNGTIPVKGKEKNSKE